MADKVTIMKKWINDIVEDPNVDASEQDLAYIIYAAYVYGTTGEKINIGEVFGKEFKMLNMIMPNIYGQIDNIKNYDPSDGRNAKYDADAIRECRLRGLTAKETCIELGYPEAKARSITTNKGWKEAGEILRGMETTVQNESESVLGVSKELISNVQKKSDLTQKLTEKDRSVQNVSDGQNESDLTFGFDF